MTYAVAAVVWVMRDTFNVMERAGCFRQAPPPLPTGYAKALAAQQAVKDK